LFARQGFNASPAADVPRSGLSVAKLEKILDFSMAVDKLGVGRDELPPRSAGGAVSRHFFSKKVARRRNALVGVRV
jgi:hypothetical protein